MRDKFLVDYSINTGEIFEDLQRDYAKFDRQFLQKIIKVAYEGLYNQPQIKIFYLNVLKSKNKVLNSNEFTYPVVIENQDELLEFPSKSYYTLSLIGSNEYVDIQYSNHIVLGRNESDFDLFFALKLSFTDIMEAEQFLQYHLENTFDNDFNAYKTFLNNISLKYKEFLQDKYVPLIERFFEISQLRVEPEKENNKEFTTARQVLAITYLLEELSINRSTTNLTEIAQFIRFLTGKESGVAKIKDTTIYKKVKTPLSKTDKAAEMDLQFVRIYFEKLALQSIVNKINKEIGSKS